MENQKLTPDEWKKKNENNARIIINNYYQLFDKKGYPKNPIESFPDDINIWILAVNIYDRTDTLRIRFLAARTYAMWQKKCKNIDFINYNETYSRMLIKINDKSANKYKAAWLTKFINGSSTGNTYIEPFREAKIHEDLKVDAEWLYYGERSISEALAVDYNSIIDSKILDDEDFSFDKYMRYRPKWIDPYMECAITCRKLVFDFNGSKPRKRYGDFCLRLETDCMSWYQFIEAFLDKLSTIYNISHLFYFPIIMPILSDVMNKKKNIEVSKFQASDLEIDVDIIMRYYREKREHDLIPEEILIKRICEKLKEIIPWNSMFNIRMNDLDL